MNISILSELLQEKGWQISQKRQGHHLLERSGKPQTVSFILPVHSADKVPAGTLDTIVKLAYARKETRSWTAFINSANAINVILEKQGDGLWGRIEMPGLLIATRGCTGDCIAEALRSLLIEFALEQAPVICQAITAIPFMLVYDTTAVWTLVKQLKANHIAEQAGIDMELIGHFMTGSNYPGPEAAIRLEKSIRELGRQLMKVSIR